MLFRSGTIVPPGQRRDDARPQQETDSGKGIRRDPGVGVRLGDKSGAPDQGDEKKE